MPSLFFEPQNLHIFNIKNILCLYYRNNTLNANEIIQAFKTKYEIKDEEGVKWFLGI
jgi:hypothetical protein